MRDSAGVTPERWIALWKRLGARSGPESVFALVAAAYAEPQRRYHTMAHVAQSLWELDHARELAERPDEVELALWLHDVVYDPRAADNEAQSAAFATRLLHEGGIAPEVRERVAALILATDHRLPPLTPDAELVTDVDLAILGASPAAFDDYERAIREEYAFVPEAAFRAGRRAILEHFLARPRLYHTAPFRERCEAAARANLARSLARLAAD